MTLIGDIKALPRKRVAPDITMLGISKDAIHKLRIMAAEYNVPMGRIAELAIVKLLAEIEAAK